MTRKLSQYEKMMVETVRTYGSVAVGRTDWRTFDRIAETGKIAMTDEIEGNNYRTATIPKEMPHDASE